MLTKADIDMKAAYGQQMPNNAGYKDLLYYYAMDYLYRNCKAQKLSVEAGAEIKKNITAYLDTMEALAHSSNKIIIELNRSIAPRADLVKKDQAELIEIITRIEGVVYGLMQEFDGKIPEFLKLEDRK